MDSVVLSAPTVRFDNGFEVRGEMTVDDSACIYLPSL
jgi:hypothetical protein